MMRSLSFLCTATLLFAGDAGLTPRPHPSDYPVQQTTSGVTLAATLVPTKQIERMFSPEIAKHYVVVEVAVYPDSGRTIDVGFLDFGLKIGETITHPEKPRDVADPWPDKGPSPNGKPVSVISTTGVVIGKSNDPVYGKRTNVGVYQDTAVTNDPRVTSPPPPPRQGPDPAIIEDRVRENVLVEGPTSHPVAGFLFFPQYKKRGKGTPMDLQWNKDGASAVLRLPEK